MNNVDREIARILKVAFFPGKLSTPDDLLRATVLWVLLAVSTIEIVHVVYLDLTGGLEYRNRLSTAAAGHTGLFFTLITVHISSHSKYVSVINLPLIYAGMFLGFYLGSV